MTVYDGCDIDIELETVATNESGTVGVCVPKFTNSQTRYVRVHTRYLEEWAEMVRELHGDGEVVVGLTPDAPIIAKPDKDHDLAVSVAPRVRTSPEDGR